MRKDLATWQCPEQPLTPSTQPLELNDRGQVVFACAEGRPIQ